MTYVVDGVDYGIRHSKTFRKDKELVLEQATMDVYGAISILNTYMFLHDLDLNAINALAKGLRGAMSLGRMSGRESLDIDKIESEVRQKQAALATNAKTKKADAKREALKDAIMMIARDRNLTLAISDKFADSIRSDVRERLGLPRDGDGWPSAATIKGAIRDIKQGNT